MVDRMQRLESDVADLKEHMTEVRTSVAILETQGEDRSERQRAMETKLSRLLSIALTILATALTSLLAILLNNVSR